MAANDPREIIAAADAGELAKMAAERLLARIAANSGRIAVCLTGGSSSTDNTNAGTGVFGSILYR